MKKKLKYSCRLNSSFYFYNKTLSEVEPGHTSAHLGRANRFLVPKSEGETN